MGAAPTWLVHEGDCREVMRGMEADSIDAIPTDPPYGLGFMGREWDHAVPGPEYWAEALRVAKPGAHLVAFGGTRCWHRLACAIEDAGWEIRDSLCWLFGSGFPKSLDVSKAIDAAAGAEREVVGRYQPPNGTEWNLRNDRARSEIGPTGHSDRAASLDRTAPATEAAQQWQGWGTALKPAHEPIILARKPLAGTVAGNVTEHGTGALNIDGCRVGPGHEGGGRDGEASAQRRYADRGGTDLAPLPGPRGGDPAGRYPANVVLDEEAARMLDEHSAPQMHRAGDPTEGCPGQGQDYAATSYHITGSRCMRYGDSGDASRFFYVAKASRSEREAGLAHRTPTHVNDGRETSIDNPYQRGDTQRRNTHPTVKPIALMRWLVRLITPPDGVVLDPFCGSGSTGCAALMEWRSFVGIDLSAEYASIARDRIRHWEQVGAQKPLDLGGAA